MSLSDRIKPISYLKANAAEIIRSFPDQSEPLIITQNGEAKAVLMGIADHERTQETMALLRLLALGDRQVEAGHTESARTVIARLRARYQRDG